MSTSVDAGYVVAVSTDVTPDLLLEGQARELVHRIQNMRRDAGFEISDHIIAYYTSDDLDRLVDVHGEYVKQETLSLILVKGDAPSGAQVAEQAFDGLLTRVGLVKSDS